MTKTNATKTFARRDSATSVLRKLGIKATDYHLFITRSEDQQFICHVKMAEEHLKKLVEQAKPKAEVKAEGGVKAVTVSARARELILAGKTNLEVWTALQAEFNLDQKKRGYPAWYRFQLRNNGEQV